MKMSICYCTVHEWWCTDLSRVCEVPVIDLDDLVPVVQAARPLRHAPRHQGRDVDSCTNSRPVLDHVFWFGPIGGQYWMWWPMAADLARPCGPPRRGRAPCPASWRWWLWCPPWCRPRLSSPNTPSPGHTNIFAFVQKNIYICTKNICTNLRLGLKSPQIQPPVRV